MMNYGRSACSSLLRTLALDTNVLQGVPKKKPALVSCCSSSSAVHLIIHNYSLFIFTPPFCSELYEFE